jgi:TolB-like protein
MASLIPGFEYDIFISYRQKDNKYDGWVTEFVDNLKRELEATFKEEVSVYFDINPNDGLLETHDVDASLREKVKCLVFIPVISRTYCDPKSFAWEYEFRAFVEQASLDQLGLKVKLPNGNVASRVLPVRIHDLDIEDISLCESILGGALRGVEFIFQSPGVNRPLRSKEENPQENQNHTIYRDQINKVANAVKEIVTGLKYSDRSGNLIFEEEEFTQEEKQGEEIILQQKKRKIGIALILVLILFIGSLFLFQHVFKKSPAADEAGKTIAVLPFQNLSNDSTQLWFCDGFVEDIRNNLQKVNSFTVRSKLSSDQFRDPKKPTTIIGNELNVNYLVGGSVGREGDNIKIWVHLIDSKADKQIWSNEYTRSKVQIFSLQSEIAREIVSELNTALSPEEKARIEKSPTQNAEAYNLYLQGRFLWNKRTREGMTKSIEFFEKSIAADSEYALAYAGLADTYSTMVYWEYWPAKDGYSKAKEYALIAVKLDPDLAEAHTILGSVLLWGEWNWDEAKKELELATELDPKCAIARQYYSEYLDIIRNNMDAREQINLALKLDPVSSAFNGTSALYYYNEGRFSESLDACLKLIDMNPEYTKNYWLCIFNYLSLGDDLKASETLQKLMRQDTLTIKIADNLREVFSKAGINGILNWIIQSQLMNEKPSPVTMAWIFAELDDKEKTLFWLERAFEEHSIDLPRVNNYFIFNKFRSEPRFVAIMTRMGLSQ